VLFVGVSLISRLPLLLLANLRKSAADLRLD
jgi:hypothetical protein